MADTLDANCIVVDIGRAQEALRAVLEPLNYKNLDTIPELADKNTTTEFLTRHVHDRLAKTARDGKLGREGKDLKAMRITSSESHLARAWYWAPLWPNA